MPDPRFFTKSGTYTLADIAQMTGSKLSDESLAERVIEDVAAVQDASVTDIAFFQNRKYREAFMTTGAGACFAKADDVDIAPEGVPVLISENPYAAYGTFARIMYPEPAPEQRVFTQPVADSAEIGEGTVVCAGAFIGENVVIGKNCIIEAGAVIHNNVMIGDNTTVSSGASLDYCIVGSHTLIYPGARIGQRGFGFAPTATGVVKIPQLGRVIIGDHVEIGANSTIDRGAGPDTVISDGAMIDNLVQVGHNAKIGKGCILVAQVGISGSAEIGDYAVLGGQVGVAGHIKIGKHVQIASKSGAIRDIEDGASVAGFPSVPIKEWHRQGLTLRKLTRKPSSKTADEE